MNVRRLLGLDTQADRYAYTLDPIAGFVSAQRESEHWVPTTCGYCSVGCGMFIGVKGGRAVSVRGNPAHPVNRGMLCPKGLSEHHTIAADGRARHPLLKENGRFAAVSWSQALGTMAARFREVQAKHGPGAVGVISTGQLVTEEFYALGKLVQLGLGTPNYDGNTTLCMSTAVSGYKRSFGSDGPPGAYEDFEQADVIVLIGANIADNHPILCRRLEANPGTTLIVVDPRVTKTAMMADLHLPIRPRSDLALLNGLIHIVIERDLVDREYIDRHTSGFEALRESVREYTPERVSEITGLTRDQLDRTAGALRGRAGRVHCLDDGGQSQLEGHRDRQRHQQPRAHHGQHRASGCGSLLDHRAVQRHGDARSWQCVLPSGISKVRERSRPRRRSPRSGTFRWSGSRPREVWRIPTSSRPRSTTGSARCGSSPPIRSSRSLISVCCSSRSMTSTFSSSRMDSIQRRPRRWLHLVLPAAIWGEKEGTYTNSERRVSKVNRAVEPPGEARPDFDIFLDLAAALGVRDEVFPGWSTPRDAFEEWKRVSAGRLCDYSGMTYEAIEEHGGIQWPFPLGATDPQQSRRLYTDGRFQTDDGRARLIPVSWEPFPEQPSDHFPLVLNTGRTVEHWHTRTKTGKVPILEHLSPTAWLEMNPRDARALRLEAQDRVDVVSRRGRVRDVELRLTETIAPGQVFVPFHYAEANANQMTQSAFDPISREPNYKQSAVRVERTAR